MADATQIVAMVAWNGGGGGVTSSFYSSKAAPRMERGGLGAGFASAESGGERKASASNFGKRRM
jgi:hypothetical protein